MEKFKSFFSLLGTMIYSALSATWYLRFFIGASRPLVSIFGGTNMQRNNVYAQDAYNLARLLAQSGMSVMSGGGPGIMEAANCGFESVPRTEREKGAITIGIGVKGIDEMYSNPCASVIKVPTFFVRKWLLTHYADAFVIFPGGIGTLDEFFELLNLVKHSLLKRVPIFLVGKEYWDPLMHWFTDKALPNGLIPVESINFFRVEDDIEAIRLAICCYYEKHKPEMYDSNRS